MVGFSSGLSRTPAMKKKKLPLFDKLLIGGIIICLIIIFFVVLNQYLNFQNLIAFDANNYDYSNPPIFFSIGDTLSAIAILFAVYQFKKDKWDLALKIRSYIIPTILTCVSLSILSSICSAIISFSEPNTIFGVSTFWQIISSLFIAFSIVFLLRKASNINLFNEKNFKRFYDVFSMEISRPTDENINSILNVLLSNFDSICKSVVQNGKENEMSQYARSIMNVALSDRSVVDLLVTKRLDGILYIIHTLKKYNVGSRHSYTGVPSLLQGLFYNHDSFLYKHLDNSGLALSSNIYTTLFDSPTLLNNFDIFYSADSSVSGDSVDVLVESISRSVKTYLMTGQVSPRHINNGLSHLSSVFDKLASRAQFQGNISLDDRYGPKDPRWSMYKIAKFLGHDYLFIGDREKEQLNVYVRDAEKITEEANFHSDSTINEGIAAAMYKCLVSLSVIEESNETYSLVLDLIGSVERDGNLREGYLAPFEKRVWEQIGANVLGHHYPLILKSYLNYIGFCLASDEGQRKGWAGEQAERMRRLLYVDLKPQIDRGEKMVDGSNMKDTLLPDCMDYRDGKFTYTMGFKRGPTVEIPPPPEDATSALEGVDWQHAYSLM